MTTGIFNLELWEDSKPILTCQHVVKKWMATKNTQRYSFDNEATGGGSNIANVPPHCKCRVLEKGFPLQFVQNLGWVIFHRIHVWHIYLHLPSKSTIHVGKYTFRPMDAMTFCFHDRPTQRVPTTKTLD